MARRVLRSSEALDKLFGEVAAMMSERPGGYTRLLKTRQRLGDATQMSIVALVGAETPKETKAEKKDETAPKKKKAAKSKKSEEATA
jgi:large subunit ribosomal protein L17